ncbi:asparagine synthase (glutamine-hydrolysing) [Melghirimyces profundicolus]|uniref:asparagine synthase (glutamine-hydrolyzing) n=1 Tax=Melghirimyces profundicolus TaxID=1242148 RepID=A0A2T6BAG8_9BACL|nr:asparagine synthase (glutamine-hydrolyzing) [Melghirimyces profundicolus]PTX53080.1 asparagine synthase (glutamine-hydrolysing) [Melghirimyces profundicolus]
MCGMTGWIDWNQDLSREREVLERMNGRLVSRGPDAEGIWLSQRAGLCHRRLIVIDPEGGSQPMVRRYGNRNLVITYNGELYNMKELTEKLQSRGHVLYSRSDTELILASYAEWGVDAPKHLNGIFAFAIWDEAEESLFIARDRIGVKPLFYVEQEGRILFASELKALLAHPDVSPRLDDDGLAEVLVMGPSRTPGHGVFKGVKELWPGMWMKAKADRIIRQRYWSLESRPHEDGPDRTVERVRELFTDAVRRQLVSDVPVGTMLSGGLDSSAISACAARHFQEQGKDPLDTFSVDYVGNDRYFKPNEFQPNADAPWVKKMSKHLSSRHHNILIDTEDLVPALDTALRARDLPGMADVDSSLYLFCREIKKKATVVLSGECADEVFGGYPWFHRAEMIQEGTFPWARMTKEKIRFLSPEVVKKIRPLEYVEDRYNDALHEVPRLPGESAEEARIREIFYLNLTRWMPTLLDRKDRMSMAVGLEVRVPFCDHHLVEYVWNVPWSMKRAGGREKGLFRQAMAGWLPDEVLWRKKSPYPKTHNPFYLEAVRRRVLHIIGDRTSPVVELLDRSALRCFAEKDLTGVHLPWFGQLMNVPQLFAFIIQLDLWMREYDVKV